MNPNQMPSAGQERSVDSSTRESEEVVYSVQKLQEMAGKYDLKNPGNDSVFSPSDIARLAAQQEEILARKQEESQQAQVFNIDDLRARARGEKKAPASGFSTAEIADIAARRITPKENGDLSRAAVEAAAKSAGVNLDQYRGPAINPSVESSVPEVPEFSGGDYGVSARAERLTPEQAEEIKQLQRNKQLGEAVTIKPYEPKKRFAGLRKFFGFRN